MPRFPALLALCALIVFSPDGRAADGRKLTLEDGDRVLLIGDVLIERENNYGVLETKMRREFPGKKFAVRNLGYSGDTPLGASRASFDPVAKGVEQLEEQLAVVKPTVAIIGYGMAASLEELTYRQNDPALNPDPARYGTEHTPARLKREVAQLMDLITKHSTGGKVRFVILGPIAHEDLRGARPACPIRPSITRCWPPTAAAWPNSPPRRKSRSSRRNGRAMASPSTTAPTMAST
jgi:hypothetical protein